MLNVLLDMLLAALAVLMGSGVMAAPTATTELDMEVDGAAPPALPTLYITDFSLYISSMNTSTSSVVLKIVDPRPDYFVNTTCTLRTNAQTPSIYKIGGWWPCEDVAAQTFWWVEEDWVRLRRVWYDEPWNPRSRVVGVSKRHSTNWKESRINTPGNKTKVKNGNIYSRIEDWPIPIETIMVK
ncbi:hypothetical protein P154DRAFT_531908 [Amniculicola lignicola CBS 123094]|uniref:Uncharacterized protein n=1 Tax=Amniculicola lignicola CBS 123094 TaxID=1392246 RepID=A0A6A5WQ67_9PLEO|nr:hypothetical protein P154DRAFT_531908 [Amniculicola lignicola CBS 123094]